MSIPNRTTMRAIWRLLSPFLFSYTLTWLWGRSAASPLLSPWSTKLSQQSQHSSASNPGQLHELIGLLLPITLNSMVAFYRPPVIPNTPVRHQTDRVPWGISRSLTSPACAVLFQSLLGIFLSKDHRSPHIVSSNHDTDDPSHLDIISPLEN